MSANASKSLLSFGFLTVCEHPPHGLFGGYLVLNTHGRPLEFHCTSPVKPSRAQEILYGPTLKPFLFGEQIGQTLLNKARSRPALICTDVEPAISVSDFIETPVVWIPAADDPALVPSKYAMVELKGNQLALTRSRADQMESIQRQLETFLEYADLREPFGRIREALDEARAPGKAS